jgi:hypothetical protein
MNRPSSFGHRLAVGLLTLTVALLVLAGTGVIAVVVVGTQIGFYRAKMVTKTVDLSPLPWKLDLATFTPIATESIVWMCTLMAVVLIVLNRPAGTWVRAMWLFASISAVVNWVHATVLNGDLMGGVVTGGLSVALPYTVHLFVLWVRHLKTGRTLAEARVETEIRWSAIGRVFRTAGLMVLDHGVHPLTAARTIWVWRTYRGIRYSAAWFIASAPLRARVQKRYTARTADTVRTPPEDTAADRPQERAPDNPDDAPHGGVLTAVRGDDGSVHSEVAAFLHYLDDEHGFEQDLQRWSEKARAHDATSGNAEPRTRPDDTNARTPDTGSKPVAKRARKAQRTGSKRRGTALKRAVRTQTARDRIRAEYARRVDAGETTDPDQVDFAAIARDLNTSRTTVSRTWRECANPEGNPS